MRAYYNCEVGTYFNIKATEIKSATSKDGLHWQIDPGVRINPLDGQEIPRGPDGQVSGPGAAEHPRVFRLPDGTFKMFYASLNLCCLWSATSVDSLTWTNRKPENLEGGDADAIVLADGRVRVFVNGTVGLPADFAGHSAGENWSRTVSYIYGPTSYRLSLPKLLPVVATDVIAPTHLPIVVEGSGHVVVKLDAFAYAGIGATSTYDLVDGSYQPVKVDYHGSYDPVKVVFNPPSGKPPFSSDAVFNWTVSSLDQSYVLSFGAVIVADDGRTKQVVPVHYAWTANTPACGAGTGRAQERRAEQIADQAPAHHVHRPTADLGRVRHARQQTAGRAPGRRALRPTAGRAPARHALRRLPAALALERHAPPVPRVVAPRAPLAPARPPTAAQGMDH